MAGFEDTSDSDAFSKSEIVLILFPLITIVIFIILGNSLVILATLVQKSLRTPPNIYLLSLALIDLSVGVFILPFNILQLINKQWNYGSFLCGFWLTADVTLCTLSIYHLIAIAIDRYRAVNEGIHYVQTRSVKSVLLTIGFLWVISIWISTPPVLGWNENDWGELNARNHSEMKLCQLTSNQGYVLHSAFGAFLLPIFLMVTIYVQIFRKIKAKLHERAKVQGFPGDRSTVDLEHSGTRFGTDNELAESSDDFLEKEVVPVPRKKSMFNINAMRIKRISRTRSVAVTSSNSRDDLQSKSGRNNSSPAKSKTLPNKTRPTSQIQEFIQKKLKFSLTKERRAARTLGIIISAFLICWLPFCLLYVINACLPKEYKHETKLWFEIFTWLGYANSAINPIIYSVYNQEFKKGFKKIFTCCRKE